ncbi:TPA: HNH endonuclease [Staphylococcus aureus]|nr:HNH endonuclease [Staphylococcus aureus]HEJ8809621.1 HNH endonuclease [Staphylococcus aureus]
MKKHELNYHYYNEIRVKLKELYTRSQQNYNFKNLKKLIVSESNMLIAMRELSYNSGRETPGPDGLKFSDIKYTNPYEYTLEWFNDFKPHNSRLVYIPKKNGKKRPLGIGNIKDRLIQQMIYNVLEPITEGQFTKSSFGFRREVSAKDAIHKLVRHGMTNPYCVNIDLENFFNEIPHWKIIQSLYDIGIHDKWLIKAIKVIIKSPIKVDGQWITPTKGVPQGGILSPLLSNVVLHQFDLWFEDQWINFNPRTKSAKKNFHSKVNSMHLKVPTDNKYKITYTSIWRSKKVHKSMYKNHQRKIRLKQGYLVRYADDFVIVSKNYNTACKWYNAVIEQLNRMGLKVNKDKSSIIDIRSQRLNFLGYELKLGSGVQRWRNRKIYHPELFISRNNIKNYKDKSRKLLDKLYHNQIESKTYNTFILGVLNYFDYITYYWNTTNSLQNDIEFKYRKLHKRNGWVYSYIPKEYEDYIIQGISLKRYSKRKVLWRNSDLNGLEVLHIWECKSKEDYKYDRPSFPHDRILWDLPNEHHFSKVFSTNWYYREKTMRRKNISCQMYFPSLFSSQKGKCARCKTHLYGLTTEVNHIIREDLGGANDFKNLELLCSPCHTKVTKEQLKEKYSK